MRAVVIEPFTHAAPTGAGWAEGLRDLGWCTEEIPTGQGGIGTIATDLMVIFDVPGGVLTRPEIVGTARAVQHFKVVAVVSDTPYFDIAAAAPYVDLFVSHTQTFSDLDARFEASGARLRHLPFGARRFFFECRPGPEGPSYEVAFIGSFWHGDREGLTYLSPLTQNGLRWYAAGCMGKPWIPYLDTARIYEKTRIGLNFHYPHQKQPDRLELNGRTFDLALAGCFQLSDQLEAQRLGLAAYASPEEWVSSVHAWLAREEDRKILAQGFRETAYAGHLWKHRMETVLGWL